MNPKQSFAACCLAASLASSAVAQVSFVDGFEGTSLDPFWTQQTASGSVTFPSTARAHGGVQSVQFNSVDTGQDKLVALTHSFAQPVSGTFSVWVWDEGAGVASSNGIFLYLEIPGGASIVVGATDYDLGIGNGGSYNYGLPNSSGVFTGIPRSRAWHHFEVGSTTSALQITIDGIRVYSGAGGFLLSKVVLGMQAPWWRPAWISYFDDFCFASSIPASYSLFGTGCAGPQGTPSLDMPAAGPRLGTPFQVQISSLSGTSLVFGILGGDNSRLVNGTPLPLSLNTIGMPGCSLFVSNDVVEYLGVRPTPTTAIWTLSIPNDCQLVGLSFFQQALVIQLGANAASMIMSNPGRGTIGT